MSESRMSGGTGSFAHRTPFHRFSLLKAGYPQGLEPVRRFSVGREEAVVYRFHPPARFTDSGGKT